MKAVGYDFCGWASKCDLLCSDGVIIQQDAFADQDGEEVPLVIYHNHNDIEAVVGKAVLESRPEGMYTYGFLNDSKKSKETKERLVHGDIKSLSIYANRLRKNGNRITHGKIQEVSLVLAGANPGAFIENVICHADDGSDEEAIIVSYDEDVEIKHEEPKEDKAAEQSSGSKKEETVADVFNTLTDKQKLAVYSIIGMIGKETDEENKEDEEVKQNLFDKGTEPKDDQFISHDDMMAVINDTKRYGSMRDSAIAHGITDIEYLFPDARTVTNAPDWIKRDTGWVSTFMNAVGHSPFSRIKSVHADITEDEARARGYIKGKLKKDEVFSLLKRTTEPKTIYKKQKIDRDDAIDITDFDVVAWIKTEMRMMLDEEIARACLVGDGRLASSDDKIDETKIRPIARDAEVYTVDVTVPLASGATSTDRAKEFIKAVIKNRKEYKGSGNPMLFTTEDMVSDMLLLEDGIGHFIYKSVAELETVLRVSKIVTTPVMENQKGVSNGELVGVVVNPADYRIGADKGGAVNMFDDFDIDYNAQKYLIETRISGALIRPKSALSIEFTTAGA